MDREFNCTREEAEDTTRFFLRGVLDEAVNLKGLFTDVKRNVEIDMGEITRINSTATRDWINEISSLPEDGNLTFTRLSIPVVRQFNMVDNMGGAGNVLAFSAPYYCDSCDKEYEENVDIKENEKLLRNYEAPEHNCPSCGQPLEFDDIERKFFHFLGKGG